MQAACVPPGGLSPPHRRCPSGYESTYGQPAHQASYPAQAAHGGVPSTTHTSWRSESAQQQQHYDTGPPLPSNARPGTPDPLAGSGGSSSLSHPGRFSGGGSALGLGGGSGLQQRHALPHHHQGAAMPGHHSAVSPHEAQPQQHEPPSPDTSHSKLGADWHYHPDSSPAAAGLHVNGPHGSAWAGAGRGWGTGPDASEPGPSGGASLLQRFLAGPQSGPARGLHGGPQGAKQQ